MDAHLLYKAVALAVILLAGDSAAQTTEIVDTCQEAGFTECCFFEYEYTYNYEYTFYDGSVPTSCYIADGNCFCDFACYRYEDCCSDIQSICPNENVFTVDPDSGNQCGGTPVIVTGVAIQEQDNLYCLFGESPVEGIYIDSTTFLCVSPRLDRPGLVRVHVVLNGTQVGPFDYFFSVTSTDVEYQNQDSSILLSTNDVVTVTWTPSKVVPITTVDPSSYTVSVNLYEVTSFGNFSLLGTIASGIPNNGQATVTIPTVQPQATPVAEIMLQIVASGTASGSDELLDIIISSESVGIWSFRGVFTTTMDLRPACNQWCDSQPPEIGSILTSRADFSCPPTLSQARLPNSGVIATFMLPEVMEFYNPGTVACFNQRNAGSITENAGQECCYDGEGTLVIGPPGGGSVDQTSPLISELDHFQNDLLPYIYCCKGQFPICSAYYEKRPSDNGENFEPLPPACVYGDPHIVTLDNHKYTFNGKGEYWLVQTPDNVFAMQGRMIEASDSGGNPVAATVFSAFVLAVEGADTVQLELLDTGNLVALVNGVMVNFQTTAVQQFNGVTLRDEGNNTLVAVFGSGVYFEARVENGFIATVLFSLDDSFRTSTSGLMGNFNGDPSDDLLPRFGTVSLPLSSTLEEIHFNFGMSWIVDNAAESLFTYLGRNTFRDFFDPVFLPAFETVFTDPTLEAEANMICGTDVFCLFDIAATGRTDVGLGTLNGGLEFDQILQLSLPVTCSPPCVNGACVANDTCSCAAGFEGIRCDQQVTASACTANPCQNGGICSMFVLDVICTCPVGFIGEFCEQRTAIDQVSCSIISPLMVSPISTNLQYHFRGSCEHILLSFCNKSISDLEIVGDYISSDLNIGRIGAKVGDRVFVYTESGDVEVRNAAVIGVNGNTTEYEGGVTVTTEGDQVLIEIDIFSNQVLITASPVSYSIQLLDTGVKTCGLCGSLDGTLLLRDGMVADIMSVTEVNEFAFSYIVHPNNQILREEHRRICGTIGNDTVIGDPLFAVPVYKDQSSLCFEVHGAANKTFNLVSDVCTSVNALYTPMRNPDDGNIISEIGIQAVSQRGTDCHEIKVQLDGCQLFVNGLEITTRTTTADGIRVRRINGNKIRVSVPNCENIRLVMSVTCLRVRDQDMLRFDISRGLNLRPSSHGLLGQFWNIQVDTEPYTGFLPTDLEPWRSKYHVFIVTPNDGSSPRRFLATHFNQRWDNSQYPCYYAGNSQGGRSGEVAAYDDPVIQGSYSDYITNGIFEHEFRFSQFEESRC